MSLLVKWRDDFDSVRRKGAGQAAVFIVTLLLAWGCAGSMPVNQVQLDKLIDSVERKSYLVKQFRADFVRTRHVSTFKRDLTVHGRLIFQKPGKVWISLKGDVNVEILSDGRFIKMIHDGKDEEVHRVRGERDLSRFEDPLMSLIDSIGNGGLRKFTVEKYFRQGHSFVAEIVPRDDPHFERMRRITISFSDIGDIKEATIFYVDGSMDTIAFTEWNMLTETDPEIAQLNDRLKRISEESRPSTSSDGSGPVDGAAMMRREVLDGDAAPYRLSRIRKK